MKYNYHLIQVNPIRVIIISRFQNVSLSWNSPVPLLTECFELCALRLIPLFFFWALLVIRLPRLFRPTTKSASKSLTPPNGDAAAAVNARIDAIASNSPEKASSSPALPGPRRLSLLAMVKLFALVPLFLVLLVEIGALVRADATGGRLVLASLLVPALEALTCVR